MHERQLYLFWRAKRIIFVWRRRRIGSQRGPKFRRARTRSGVDLVRRRLTASDGREELLTSGEYELLVAFVTHPERVLSRDQLLDFLGKEEAFDRSIDVQVMRLRRKIEANHEKPELIQAVRGAGYTFYSKVRWT